MVFCTHQCLQEFIDNPNKYIEGIYEYVKENPIVNWKKKTNILYGNKDNLQDENLIKDFCSKYNCELDILENGEHYFHTEGQLAYYKEWLNDSVK